MNESTVPSKDEYLSKIYEFIEDELKVFEISLKCKLQLELAIEELFVNIGSYAYEDEGKITIKTEVLTNPDRISITFIDSGVEFNPLKQEQPNLSLSSEERPIGGLGILLVEKNVDEIIYNYINNKNQLTIIKNIF